jgi:hypothetical protein
LSRINFIKNYYKASTIEKITELLNNENKLDKETSILLKLEQMAINTTNLLKSLALFDDLDSLDNLDVSDNQPQKTINDQKIDYNTEAKELLRTNLKAILKQKELEKRLTKELSTFTGPQLLDWKNKKPNRIIPFLTKFVQNNDTTIKSDDIKETVLYLNDIVENIIKDKTKKISFSTKYTNNRKRQSISRI